ncbi:feruloyl CoA ortho-hydroxylase 1-like [Eucalyptus grandis]|uniref:feruloyl CoA ortho-hydroxylase 1-like n=1 Tax=Eucalyptus grandis TaxID=71139 RepID=UPI00192EF06C|nr:feruloyl CoA ortho-hydroxylase 1-like [Eucalyptus grandis]
MKPRKPRFFESRGTLTDESNPLASGVLDSGFFYVINHGVSQDLMEEVFVQSRRFFGLPLSEKMKLVRNEKHQSYTPLFDQVLHPANQINGLCLKILLLKMDIDASDIAKFL